MIVVADSSPLHYLILLEQVDLLRRFYKRVAIPDAVISELSAVGTPPAVRCWIEELPSWVDVVPVGPQAIETVTDRLDRGERAAIGLAMLLGADLLLVDDAAGRAEARRLCLRVTGTLGVLRIGAEHGLLDVPRLLEQLRATTFYADEKVLLAIFGRWL